MIAHREEEGLRRELVLVLEDIVKTIQEQCEVTIGLVIQQPSHVVLGGRGSIPCVSSFALCSHSGAC